MCSDPVAARACASLHIKQMPRGKHKLFKEQNTFKTDMNYISLDLKAH